MIIIVRVEANNVLLMEDKVKPCFPLRSYGEASGYYICCKHSPCVFPLGRSIVTSTAETAGDGVCVIGYGFVIHLWREMRELE